MGFRSLPQVLWQNLSGSVALHPRKVIVGSGMGLTDNADSTVTISATGTNTLAADTDVVISSPADTEVLTYDSGLSKWKNAAASGGGGGATDLIQTTVGNQTGGTLTKGTVVSSDAGVTSGVVNVFRLTDTTDQASSSDFMGVLTGDIVNGATGTCTKYGLVSNLDTSLFTVGTFMYAGTAGALTDDPSTFYHRVGTVITQHATTGSIFVNGDDESAPSHSHSSLATGSASIITALTADATPDSATDYVRTFDASAGTDKKVLLSNLPGGGSGTVTSVAATVPTGFSVSGSPVTTTGTLGITLDSQTANKVLASATSGGTATPAFRALVAADIPAIAESGVTSLVTDLGLKAPIASPTFTGITTAPEFSASGLTGATAASRYVGATASGAPVSGTFVLGDWAPDQTGKRWTCTVGGTPGTWVQEPGTGGAGDVATDVIWDAKGDLAVGTGANTAAKLTVGADDTIPMADAAATTGIKWVASQTPSTQAFGDSAAQGTADTYARGDHVHGMPAAPASSALTLIGSQTLSGTAASVTFSSIPGTYTNLQLWCLVWTNSGDAVGTDTLWMRFNSDSTSAHYGSVAMYGGAIGPGNDATTTDTKLTLGVNEVGGTVSPYAFTPFIIDIPFYTQTTTIKPVFARTFRIDAVGTNLLMKHSIANWNQTSAITQIDLLPSAGSFISGCKFWLYGAS